MNKKEFMEYKRERLKEIAVVIKESSGQMNMNPQKMELEDMQDRLEKLKNSYPWLR
ncbi:MAG: hypothetical protein V3T58_02140 [Candidatus Hydrothermarchaeales archaeon]